MNPVYLIGVCICIALFTVVIATFSSLSQKDSANNTKLLTIIISFSFASSIFAYGLALYYFSHNPDYLLHFILAIAMMILLPGSLISASIGSIAVSNMRDAAANS
jgi:uncharacterized membrane protein (GlpM family)